MAERDFQTTIKLEGVDELLTALKTLSSPATQKQFRKDMGNAVRPTAAIIKARVPTQGRTVMSGMVHQGRTRWNPVKTVIRFDLKPRKNTASYKPLLQINVTGSPGGLGFDYAELAGASKRRPRPETKEFTRRTANGSTKVYTRINNHGDQFIQVLKARFPMRANAGRFAYRVFRQELPELEKKALAIFETYAAKINRKVRSF